MRTGWVKVCLLAILPAMTGCLYHTRKIQQPHQAGPALSADVAALVNGVNERYAAIQSLTATVEFAAETGGAHKGKQTDITPFRGYILLRKPEMLRVLGLVPVLHTHAFDLASNGTTFTLLIPPRNRAIVGSNSVTKTSLNPIENLRPEIFSDAVLVRAVTPNRLVYLTLHSDLQRNDKTKQLIETPQYDLMIGDEQPSKDPNLSVQVIKPTRVIRFSRIDLLPVEQDIYNAEGDVATQVLYGSYQNFGTTKFPSVIVIKRPLEEYQITVTVQKLTVNQTLPDEQFQVKVPEGYQVEKLD